MVKRAILLILSAALLALCGCAQSPEPSGLAGYVSRSRAVFGDGIVFTASVRGGDEQAALDEMEKLLNTVNAEMSLSVTDSALAKFNAAGAGERIRVSEQTYELIQKSIVYHAETGGTFNIAAYPLTKLWHVDTDGLNEYAFCDPGEAPAPPSAQEVENALGACDIGGLQTDCEDDAYYIYKTDARLQIDLGAVAKGYAADACIRIAKEHGVQSAMINISGNISLLGEWYRPQEKAYMRWNVGVTAPRPAKGLGGNLCALSVPANKTLVTSGDYERYYETVSGDNVLTVPHIVSGITGLPLGVAATESGYANTANHIISATVICEDSAMADAYATAACVMGAEAATAFLCARNLGGILVTNDGEMTLINVTESSENGEVYFALKDDFSKYTQYRIKEVAS